MKHIIYIHWTWGTRSDLRERTELHSPDGETEEQMKQAVRNRVSKLAKYYCFDCGRVDYPLKPVVNSVEILPVSDSKTFYDAEWLNNAEFRNYEEEFRKSKA